MFLLIRIKLHSGSVLAIPKTVSRPIPDDVPVMRTVRVILNELPLNRWLYCTNLLDDRMQSLREVLQRVLELNETLLNV